MSPRASMIALALTLVACELPEPAGPTPTQAGLGPGGSLEQSSKIKRPIKKLPQPLVPKDKPSEPTQPPPPSAPTGEEVGPLVGLRAAHDQARAAVGVAPLTWSVKVAAHAQQWADQLAANNCQLSHRPNNPYGENLYWSSSGVTAQKVVETWVAESAHYDVATHTCAQGQICGHYTQIVWANTTSLGCGRATCGSQEVWVCNYDPRGNYNGQAPF